MALTIEDVGRVARLARIRVDDDRARVMLDELNGILGLIEQMQAAETSGVLPMSHPRDVAQRLRPDEVTEQDRREDFLAIAPAAEAGLYLVPKVIE